MVVVCRAGHLLNEHSGDETVQDMEQCPVCGAETLSACPGCREPLSQPGPPLPRYCICCGRPFPWTERVMSAVRSMIREIAALDQYERDQLRRSIDHIVHETPQTRLAVLRINTALSRIGGETAASLRALLLSIASAGVKPLLQPD